MSVLKLIFSIIHFSDFEFTKDHVKDNFRKVISEHVLFKYSPDSVWRLRCEVYQYMAKMSGLYRDKRIDMDGCESVDMSKISEASLDLPEPLKFSFLCKDIERGDFIDIKLQTSTGDDLIQRAVVQGIRLEADGVTKSLVVSGGIKVVNSLHLIRRVTMRDISTKTPLWNPVPDWYPLSEFHLEPTEDVREVYKHDRMNQNDKKRNAKKRNERERAHNSLTHTGHIGKFFHWMGDDDCAISQEIRFLNALYIMCIELGKLACFYDLLKCNNKDSYEDQKKKSIRTTNRWKNTKGYIILSWKLPFQFFASYTSKVTGETTHVPPSTPNTKRQTNHQMKVLEETLKYEHDNQHIVTQFCPSCRQNHINQVTHHYSGAHPYMCDSCKSLPRKDHYLHYDLLPIWYERIPGATHWNQFKYVDGKRVVRYDIPEELAVLRMSEKLLIRKAAPFIQTTHLSYGYYALTGNCLAFPQDISPVVTELPRLPDKMTVTYVRQMGNSSTRDVRLKSMNVRRDAVIRALKWLQIHHSEYRDINIVESNLDWMKGSEEAEMTGPKRTTYEDGKGTLPCQTAAVSEAQCATATDEPILDCSIMEDQPDRMDPNQAKYIDELVNTTIKAKKSDKLLMFPPHGDEPLR